MTKEQLSISKKNHKIAVEYFKFNGEWFEGCVLHHIDSEWRHNDVERYIQWFPRDLQVVTKDEHVKIHHSGKPLTDEHKKKLSESMTGNINVIESHKGKKLSEEHKKHISEGHTGLHYHIGQEPWNKGKHLKLVDGKRVYY